MAKSNTIQVKLVSSANTGFFYVKNKIKGFVSKLAANIVPRITPVATKKPKQNYKTSSLYFDEQIMYMIKGKGKISLFSCLA